MAKATGGLEAVLCALRGRGDFTLTPRGVWKVELTQAIDALSPPAGRDGEAFRCLLSGLHLWNDDLDRSHRIAQEIGTPTGSCWHGIMHRREGDYGNSKYWFRRVGEHPVFAQVLKEAQALAKAHVGDPFAKRVAAATRWDPFAWVDACTGGEERPYLRAVQTAEIGALAAWGGRGIE